MSISSENNLINTKINQELKMQIMEICLKDKTLKKLSKESNQLISNLTKLINNKKIQSSEILLNLVITKMWNRKLIKKNKTLNLHNQLLVFKRN